jgi:hypothetical protein
LERERYEFFETRVTGRREVWAALKTVCESVRDGDLATAQGILDAAGFTLPTGYLEEGGYDEAGNLYRIPKVILSDPTNLGEGEGDDRTVVGTAEVKDKEIEVEGSAEETKAVNDEKGKAAVDKDALKIKCRLSDRGGPDVVVLIGKTQTVGALMQRVRDEGEVSSKDIISDIH